MRMYVSRRCVCVGVCAGSTPPVSDFVSDFDVVCVFSSLRPSNPPPRLVVQELAGRVELSCAGGVAAGQLEGSRRRHGGGGVAWRGDEKV